jgi:methylenetetrahydrofolate reductase (NADPH)
VPVFKNYGLRDKLENRHFVVTVELDPPKGADPTPTIEKAKHLYGFADAVNVTDSPMATLRMSPIALAHIIQQDLGIEAVFHLTCRDRNILGLQAELLGAAALGVRNILTLTGDSPARGDHPEVKGVFETDSIGLARIARTLNGGTDMAGKPLNKPTQFFIGGAANPGADDLRNEIEKLKAKVDGGVQFVQTQPIFDLETALRFEEKIQNIPVHVIYGLLPLKGIKQAVYMNEKVPGITIGPEIMKRVEEHGRAAGVEIARELYQGLRSFAKGVHLFPIGDLSIAYDVLGIQVDEEAV